LLSRGGFHLLGRCTAAHVKEVGRLTSLKLDNVHRGHSKTGTVHHAADVSVEGAVVQTDGSGFGLVEVEVFAGFSGQEG